MQWSNQPPKVAAGTYVLTTKSSPFHYQIVYKRPDGTWQNEFDEDITDQVELTPCAVMDLTPPINFSRPS